MGGEARLRQIGDDQVARELEPVRAEVGGRFFLLLIDHSSEARLERRRAQLGREVEDLRSELLARERAPLRARIRTAREVAQRLDETAKLARRYRHSLTILTAIVGGRGNELDHVVLGCIRGVDDIGRVDAGHYLIVLPHTDLTGGKVVAERLVARIQGAGATAGVGVAQARGDEAGSALVARAEHAARQSQEVGGGALLAVDVL
jgi:hypothetical protein